jgi:hypothetical protein
MAMIAKATQKGCNPQIATATNIVVQAIGICTHMSFSNRLEKLSIRMVGEEGADYGFTLIGQKDRERIELPIIFYSCFCWMK